MSTPNYDIELDLRARGFSAIAGADEAGRGPMAGPVVAAAVVLNPYDVPEGLNDSKKLTEKRRVALEAEIKSRAVWAVALATVEEIDDLNILNASLLAMQRAIEALSTPADFALIDGNKKPAGLVAPCASVVAGDARSVSIAAASILAKNERDRIMVDLAQQHPGYGWDQNKGYPTVVHKKALRDLGVTPHHRRSFKPVHNILYQEKLVSD